MAIDKVTSASITTDAVGPTQLNEAANYDFTGTVTGAGESNTPLFSAYKGSAQSSLAANTYHKITFTTEEFDPDSVYDATNSKFVAPSNGKYFFSVLMRMNPNALGPTGFSPAFYKNGSLFKFNRQLAQDSQSGEFQLMMDLSTNDYVEVYLYYHDDVNEVQGDVNNSVFQGFKISS